MTPMLKKIL